MFATHGNACAASRNTLFSRSSTSNDLFERMAEGTRAISFRELDSSHMIHMCTLQLSQDRRRLHISIDHSQESSEYRIVHLSDIARVAASNLDENSLALLLPTESEILEFIFGCEEDYRMWLGGLQELCQGSEHKPETRSSTPDTAPSEDGRRLIDAGIGRLVYHETICELIELVYELQNQNSLLVLSREKYLEWNRALLLDLRDTVNENVRLQTLISSRESTIADLCQLLLSQGQGVEPCSRRASLSSVETSMRPHDCATE